MSIIVSKFVQGSPLVKNGTAWPDPWVAQIATELKAYAPSSPISGECRIEIEFYLDEQAYQNVTLAKNGSDLDNLLPPIFRGIEYAKILLNDSQINEVNMKKIRAKINNTTPGVIIRIYA